MFKYIEYVQNSEELILVLLMFRPVLLQKFEEYLSKLHSQTVDSNETLSHVKPNLGGWDSTWLPTMLPSKAFC